MVTRRCKICGKQYEVCPTCRSVKTFASWRLLVCDPQEYQLFTVLSQYDLDKDAVCASDAIKQIGISDEDIKKYIPSVQKQISEIKSKLEAIKAQENKNKSKKAKQKPITSEEPDD